MATTRQINCITRRHQYFDPHELIERVGGLYLGEKWNMPDYLVIYHIKKNIEQYFVMVNSKRVNIIVGNYLGREYLKGEADAYKPETLLNLPMCVNRSQPRQADV